MALFNVFRKIIDRNVGSVKYFAMTRGLGVIKHSDAIDFGSPVCVTQGVHRPKVLVVCEHASNRMPEGLDFLGLSEQARRGHVAWDPGALGVAEALSGWLGAPLVRGNISRLVYDCNRPPVAPSAIPERSEVFDIPGNQGLSQADRAARVTAVYRPFRDALAQEIARHRETLRLLITIHSFTPVFNGTPRSVELGIVHGQDPQFAQSMLERAPSSPYDIRLNEPYGPDDGVTHTLDLHGAGSGLLSVMIEVRNDLIETPEAETRMAGFLVRWVSDTLEAAG